MDFMTAIKTCFSNYFNFSGRARRSEFWWFYLFVFVTGLIPFVGIVITLAALIPYIAVSARRLHDTDRSGWWQLGPLVPLLIGGTVLAMAFVNNANQPDTTLSIIGGVIMLLGVILAIVMIVWLASDSQPGANRFGPSPK